MGNSLPVRSIFLIILLFSCTKTGSIFEKDTVYRETFSVDSTYSYFVEANHSSSLYLYCGKKELFQMRSLIRFETPDTTDSIYLFLIGDKLNDSIFFYTLKDSFNEDSISFDLSSNLKNSLFYKGFYNTDTVIVKIYPPYDNIKNGLIIETDSVYKFSSKENSLYSFIVLFEKTRKDTLKFIKDTYVCTHPLIGDTLDTLMVASGISGRINFFINKDSLKLDSLLYSRFDLGLSTNATCSLIVNLQLREKVFKTIGGAYVKPATNDTLSFIALINSIPDLISFSDTIQYYKFTLKMNNEDFNPRFVNVDSLKIFIMFVEEKE